MHKSRGVLLYTSMGHGLPSQNSLNNFNMIVQRIASVREVFTVDGGTSDINWMNRDLHKYTDHSSNGHYHLYFWQQHDQFVKNLSLSPLFLSLLHSLLKCWRLLENQLLINHFLMLSPNSRSMNMWPCINWRLIGRNFHFRDNCMAIAIR